METPTLALSRPKCIKLPQIWQNTLGKLSEDEECHVKQISKIDRTLHAHVIFTWFEPVWSYVSVSSIICFTYSVPYHPSSVIDNIYHTVSVKVRCMVNLISVRIVPPCFLQVSI